MPKKFVKKVVKKVRKAKSTGVVETKNNKKSAAIKKTKKSASSQSIPSPQSAAKKKSTAAKKKTVKKKAVRKIDARAKKLPTLFAAAKDFADSASHLNPNFPQPNPLPEWDQGWLTVFGAREHNLKSIDVAIPLGTFTVVTGVSGSGKSSFVEDVLYNTLALKLHRASLSPGAHERIEGLELVNKVIRVDQQPIGQTPTSNPATYTGAFDLIRNLFAQLPDAKLRGYTSRRFSFNVAGGRCEKCEGNGQLKIEMHFLPDVWITCDACQGKRYDRQTLEVKFRGYSISDVLEMSCGQALELFQNVPKIRRILQTICDVGLDYLSLGQAAPTLSGGEAQRVKLASELARPDTGRTLYLLDEPTTGLHFDDLKNLLEVVQRLVDVGNTVIMIEHNLDMIKSADWVIDLGPEAGLEGGRLVYAGTPEALVDYGKRRDAATETERAKAPRSYTAEALAPILEAGPFVARKPYHPKRKSVGMESDNETSEESLTEILGEDAQMPWESDGRKWHTQTLVSRAGKSCKWNGRILTEIIDKIQESDVFAETNWNDRATVEVRAKQKSLGWFLHAITSGEWLLRLKFRTAKHTFRRDSLIKQLNLIPLNDIDDIPLYGAEPRVGIMNPNGAFQEILLRVHSYEEIDRPEFWNFLDTAIQGFAKFTDKTKASPEELAPWRILKEKWHFLPKGFIGGTTPVWSYSLLEELLTLIKNAAPDASPVWTNKVLVPFQISGAKFPWRVHTKRTDGIYLELPVAKNSIPLGSIRGIGYDQFVDGSRAGYDVVTLVFTKESHLNSRDLIRLLQLALKHSLRVSEKRTVES
ncbi:MAG: ATP-binding cassette domain-containing protein [Planctomycetaceae bacterium]|jgi:excinuclease ABC subunit A|nr:ATP-binding cassette domain-containing protein [Planctomycetaceae bacterium]